MLSLAVSNGTLHGFVRRATSGSQKKSCGIISVVTETKSKEAGPLIAGKIGPRENTVTRILI